MDILLSIYPKYCELIRSREKNFEFRNFKIDSQEEFHKFWVYETKPSKMIKYCMIVKNPITEISELNRYNLGVEEFKRIMTERKYAYEILRLEELVQPITLEEMISIYSLKAPQSFLYLENKRNLWEVLQKKKIRKIF